MRWIDAGVVPPYRTQTLYHGLAHAFDDTTPGTVAVCTPSAPYVCVGYHQDLEREVDTAYCDEAGFPVIRRELGGGAVYLDPDQWFVQWILPEDRLPRRIEDRFRLFTRPIIETYRALGVDATFHPPNDIHVAGRKICGTGAARVGDAEVLVGNFLFDFDCARMARILRLDSEVFRSEVQRGLERYMTSLRRELGTPPSLAQVQEIYRERCQDALGVDMQSATPTPEETRSIEEVERRFQSDAFRKEPGGMRRHGVKIHEHIWIRAETVDTPTGPVHIVGRIDLAGANGVGTLDRIRIVAPGEDYALLEAALQGVTLDRSGVDEAIRTARRSSDRDSTTSTMTVGDVAVWVNALERLAGKR